MKHLIRSLGDGQVFAGSYRSIVHQMHATSRAPAENDRSYVTEAASRALLMTGCAVRDSSPRNFITDLVACGLVEELDRRGQ